MLQLYQRVQNANISLTGDLAFMNTWNFFAPHPDDQFEQLTSKGPYAGTLQAFMAGHHLKTRYHSLHEQAIAQGQTALWASDSTRDIETAQYFAAGFFGIKWNRTATLHIIPETRAQGGNTLTPGRACPNYIDNQDEQGHRYGNEQFTRFRATYLHGIRERLLQQNPHIIFTDTEIYSMQELCGFEMLTRGESLWCKVFTHDEWASFEYARDLLHYYRSGPGNPYGAPGGMLWLKATAELLRKGPEAAGPLFFSL